MSCQRFGWREPGDVGVRELVDQDQRRTARQRRIEIEFGERAPWYVDLRARQDLEALQQRLGFLAAVGLEEADDDVLAFAAQRPRRGQHRVGLADAGRGAEIDAQAAALRARLLRLDLREQLVGIGRSSSSAGST